MSTVIGWFLVTCTWSNSNVSRPGYNCAVVTHVPNTTACDQCMTKLKMAWSSAHAHNSLFMIVNKEVVPSLFVCFCLMIF